MIKIKLILLSVALCIGLKTTNSQEFKCTILEQISENDENLKVYCYNAYEEDIDFLDDKKSSISELKLARSNIKYIDQYLFEGFSNLTNLAIIDSGIEEIEPDALSQLENLEILEITLGELQKLDDYAFKNLTNLNELILNDNLIREIDPYTFSNLTNLKVLQIKNNELKEIYIDTFEGLMNVEVIDLSGNPIESIEEFSFNTCTSLKTLILERSSQRYVKELLWSNDFEVVFVSSERKSQHRLKMVMSQEFEDLRNELGNELFNSPPNRIHHPILALSMIITLAGVIIFMLLATILISCILKRFKYINQSCTYSGAEGSG